MVGLGKLSKTFYRIFSVKGGGGNPPFPLSFFGHNDFPLREDINSKKTFSFGHCPNDGGGGGLPMRGFFGPLFLPSNSP